MLYNTTQECVTRRLASRVLRQLPRLKPRSLGWQQDFEAIGKVVCSGLGRINSRRPYGDGDGCNPILTYGVGIVQYPGASWSTRVRAR